MIKLKWSMAEKNAPNVLSLNSNVERGWGRSGRVTLTLALSLKEGVSEIVSLSCQEVVDSRFRGNDGKGGCVS